MTQIIGYYTSNACMTGNPYGARSLNTETLNDKPTKIAIMAEDGTTSFIPPPINPAEIIKLMLDTFPIELDKTLDWDFLKKLDERVTFNKYFYVDSYSSTIEKRMALTRAIALQIAAIHSVEQKLQNEWGIGQIVKEIIISNIGSSNTAQVILPATIAFYFGNPQQLLDISSRASYLFGHELGHILYFYNTKGINWSPESYNIDIIREKTALMLNRKKDLSCQYLEDVPYHLFPSGLIFPPKNSESHSPASAHLFFWISECVIADKIASQLCAPEEYKGEITNQVNMSSKLPSNAWDILYLWIHREKYNPSPSFRNLLYNELIKHKSLWNKSISTDKFLSSLSRFYKSVSLKKQPSTSQ